MKSMIKYLQDLKWQGKLQVFVTFVTQNDKGKFILPFLTFHIFVGSFILVYDKPGTKIQGWEAKCGTFEV